MLEGQLSRRHARRWYSGCLLPLAAALVALAAAPAALAGPSLFVGAAEDGAVWGDPTTQMALAQQAGFDSIRMTAQWVSGNTRLDPIIAAKLRNASAAAEARGLRPVVSIYNTDSVQAPGDPILRSEFAAFAQDVVLTLPDVKTFIVGSEPNSSYYWQPQFDTRGADIAASAYEALLADTYDAIKSVRPDATVIGGALDSHGTDNPKSRPSHSPLVFLRDMGRAYRASKRTRPIMDVFDQHIYGDNSSMPPSMSHPNSSTITEGDYSKLVAALGQAFDGTAQPGSSLPIVYGEYGVESAIPPNEAGSYSGHENATAKPVDEATQASYYIQAMKLAMCQPNVVGIMLFHVEDEAGLPGWQSGLFYADGTPKSSLDAVRTAAAAARAGTLTTCPDSTAPVVSVGSAANGTLVAQASDDVGIAKVELYANGVFAGTDYAAPYTFSLAALPKGTVNLVLKAYDAAGNVGQATVVLRLRAARAARRR
ncbi:MAG TPA: Ig-like domain-containing protein [Gaiellaceae bacterium]|nr:Ig-like domain-containing protein [Gaiellaceae bacterium]